MSRKPLAQQIKEQQALLAQLKAREALRVAKERTALAAKQRQEDTRRKIQNGGLVTLAGLASLEKDVLLGLLLEMADRLAADTTHTVFQACKARGHQALAAQAAKSTKSAAAQSQG